MSKVGKSSARVLLLGAGLLHKYHYDIIKEMGFYCIGMDSNPQASARNKADVFFSNNPAECDEVYKVAKKSKADIILPLSEFAIIPAAEASKLLGLNQISPETAKRCRDKLIMRELWGSAGIQQPRFATLMSTENFLAVAQPLGYPLILKPRRSWGARGVRIIANEESLLRECSDSKLFTKGPIMLEQFISGTEASIEGIVVDGEVYVLAIGDKQIRKHSRYSVTQSINYPGQFSTSQNYNIKLVSTQCVKALGLYNSPFHLEVFVIGEKVIPIECGARGGGGHIYSYIVEMVSGINLVKATVLMLLGKKPKMSDIKTHGACYRFLFPPSGLFLSIVGVDTVLADPNVVDLVIAAEAGELIVEPDNGSLRKGYLLTKGTNRQEASINADSAEEKIEWIMAIR